MFLKKSWISSFLRLCLGWGITANLFQACGMESKFPEDPGDKNFHQYHQKPMSIKQIDSVSMGWHPLTYFQTLFTWKSFDLIAKHIMVDKIFPDHFLEPVIKELESPRLITPDNGYKISEYYFYLGKYSEGVRWYKKTEKEFPNVKPLNKNLETIYKTHAQVLEAQKIALDDMEKRFNDCRTNKQSVPIDLYRDLLTACWVGRMKKVQKILKNS